MLPYWGGFPLSVGFWVVSGTHWLAGWCWKFRRDPGLPHALCNNDIRCVQPSKTTQSATTILNEAKHITSPILHPLPSYPDQWSHKLTYPPKIRKLVALLITTALVFFFFCTRACVDRVRIFFFFFFRNKPYSAPFTLALPVGSTRW